MRCRKNGRSGNRETKLRSILKQRKKLGGLIIRPNKKQKEKEQSIRNDNGALAVTDEDKKIAWKSYCEELSSTEFFCFFF